MSDKHRDGHDCVAEVNNDCDIDSSPEAMPDGSQVNNAPDKSTAPSSGKDEPKQYEQDEHRTPAAEQNPQNERPNYSEDDEEQEEAEELANEVRQTPSICKARHIGNIGLSPTEVKHDARQAHYDCSPRAELSEAMEELSKPATRAFEGPVAPKSASVTQTEKRGRGTGGKRKGRRGAKKRKRCQSKSAQKEGTLTAQSKYDGSKNITDALDLQTPTSPAVAVVGGIF